MNAHEKFLQGMNAAVTGPGWLETRQEWDTEALQRDFKVVGFLAPYVVVIRRSDGVKGTLEFTHSPRVYFGFTSV